MEWSWVGSMVIAVASLVGVVVTVVSTSRQGVKRLEFESRQADRTVEMAERARVRDAVDHVAEFMLDAVAEADYDADNDDDAKYGPPRDFDEEWPKWFERRQRQIRREVALIREENPRIVLEMVLVAMDFAHGVARFTSQYATADAVVRETGHLGFEVASAWLREQEAGDAFQPALDRLSTAVHEFQVVVSQMSAEHAERAERQRVVG